MKEPFFPSIKNKPSPPGQPRFHRFSKEFSVRLRRRKFIWKRTRRPVRNDLWERLQGQNCDRCDAWQPGDRSSFYGTDSSGHSRIRPTRHRLPELVVPEMPDRGLQLPLLCIEPWLALCFLVFSYEQKLFPTLFSCFKVFQLCLPDISCHFTTRNVIHL